MSPLRPDNERRFGTRWLRTNLGGASPPNKEPNGHSVAARATDRESHDNTGLQKELHSRRELLEMRSPDAQKQDVPCRDP